MHIERLTKGGDDLKLNWMRHFWLLCMLSLSTTCALRMSLSRATGFCTIASTQPNSINRRHTVYFHKTLWLLMMYYPTKLARTKIASSENVVVTVIV